MKLKFLIGIFVAAALFSGVVLWRVDRFMYGDRLAWAEAQARSQISSLSQAIRAETQSARRMLASVQAETFKKDRTNWNSFQPYYVVALMTNKGDSLSISQISTRADSSAAGWTAAQLGQYIGFMGKELENRGTVILRSFKDPKKNTHVALIFAGGEHAYILVGSGGNFQSLVESQKGSASSFSIVASDGLTISHAIPDYIGTVMGDSSLMKEIRTTGAAQGLGTYMQGKIPVFGMYEQVVGTNAYIISTVPTEDLMKGRLSLAWQFVFLIIGFALIGAAVYFWYEKKYPQFPSVAVPMAAAVDVPSAAAPPPVVRVSDGVVVTSNSMLVAPRAPKTPPPPTATNPTATLPPSAAEPPSLQAEKAEAFRQVAAAMGSEMRAPLASILGFSQMVLAKTQDAEVVQAVESILREARSSRDVLDMLVTFSGEQNFAHVEAKIDGPIVEALKKLETRLKEKGVKTERDFKATSPWPLSFNELEKAFENIFENSIEAMDRMQDKTLKVSTWESSEGLHVSVTDSGEGIEQENLAKIFDPFFTTRSYAHHVGLGLPVVAGILKEHGAQIKVQSDRGKGTRVDILFMANAKSATKASDPSASSSLMSVGPSDLPSELPTLGNISHEEKAAVMKEAAAPKESLVDKNVEHFLDLPPEEEPLQFLDGMGFDDDPRPTAPLPVVESSLPPKPLFAPPPISAPEPEAVEAVETVEIVEAVSLPPEVPPAPPPAPTVMIDKPSFAGRVERSSGLDSYKVDIRRPGKRT